MIECHLDHCPNHSIHEGDDEGPFCYQTKCTMTGVYITFLVNQKIARSEEQAAVALAATKPVKPKNCDARFVLKLRKLVHTIEVEEYTYSKNENRLVRMFNDPNARQELATIAAKIRVLLLKTP